MYEIIFYHSRNGESEIEKYLDELSERAKTSKTDRINRTKIPTYLHALSQYRTRIGQPVVKHIEGNIWELRPLNNRIFSSTGRIINLFCCTISLKNRRRPRRESWNRLG